FGFNLAPLLSRADEFARLALEVAEERRLLRQARETLAICRRDVRKLISAALQEGADGDWLAIEARYADLTAHLPRVPSLVDVEGVLPAMEALREEIVNALEKQMKLRETAANDIQNGRHIQNSHPESIPESEPQTKPPRKDISVRNVANLVQTPKAF
ncbi:helix-turn-helix domain-containing protein, partial [Rhizobium sp. YJ-22]|uniref:helix-turn-helix domain-containing protein n=1 Tax=Rhizobium sp. YJ-22 TaxID=3037556 RepID=UPI002412443B